MLDKYRRQIDKIDTELVKLFEKLMSVSKEIQNKK